jgi:toxin CptA
MQIVIASVAFFCAALCAALMGYAIQRGATCTVAAVDEIMTERSARRLLSLVEAALWVAGGLLVARALQVLPALPAGYAVSGWTVAGGFLLGLGAVVNGACVFGAIARFGSGEWVYLATPLGFFAGCLSVAPLFGAPLPRPLPDAAPALQTPAALPLLFVAFVVWRVGGAWRARDASSKRRWHAALAARVWTPHAATLVIAATFVAMLLLVGAWAYTDALAELAHGMTASVAARALLFVVLLLGAAWGGWTAGLFRHRSVSAPQLFRCFVGGMLMGWGSLVLPGGNDGLILVAMPLAWPYAWLAFATMCVTIAMAQLVTSRWRLRPRPTRSSRRRERGTR